jgi:hypothetical protein
MHWTFLPDTEPFVYEAIEFKTTSGSRNQGKSVSTLPEHTPEFWNAIQMAISHALIPFSQASTAVAQAVSAVYREFGVPHLRPA